MTLPREELVSVVDVHVTGAYELALRFDTGETGLVDMLPLMRGPVFEEIRSNYDVFRDVRVDPDTGTVAWPNGADWDPVELYNKARGLRRGDPG